MATPLPIANDFDEEALGFGEPEGTPPPPPLSVPEKAALALVALGILSLGVQLLEQWYSSASRLTGSWLGLLTSYPLAGLGTLLFFWSSYKDTHAGIKHDGLAFKSITSRGTLGWLAAIALTGFYVLLYWADAGRNANPWVPRVLALGLAFGLVGVCAKIAGSGVRIRSILGWAGAVGLTGFFVLLYWGGPTEARAVHALEPLIRPMDPLAVRLTGAPANQWFLYGFLYSVLVLAFGVRTIMKYRHNRYQIVRTISVVFFQLILAFTLPQLMKGFYQQEPYFTYFWPLKYDALFPSSFTHLTQGGNLGAFTFYWGVIATFVLTPVLTYFFGKRWYCSWVCGCGGLAETLGDGFRQLSDKSVAAWSLERGVIYTVLGAIVVTTGLLWANHAGWLPSGNLIDTRALLAGVGVAAALGLGIAFSRAQGTLALKGTSKRGVLYLGVGVAALLIWGGVAIGRGTIAPTYTVGQGITQLSKLYGFLIGAAFSGVIGVGFYPIFGSRVWCRFGCPMAAILGILQRTFSRFRITTNGGQCISCGNCSTYCEMGIDVRDYAQRGENIVRASCVGCGVCAAVCPRGVLKLENGPLGDRFENQRPEMGSNPRPLPIAER